HESGFKAVVTGRGASAIAKAREIQPAAITLDINLPDFDGWRVLDRLKDDATTRHIPVQIITTDEETQRGRRLGAIGALTKPIKSKETLDETFNLIGGDDVEIVQVESGKELLEQIPQGQFDAAIIGIHLPEMKSFELLDEIHAVPEAGQLPLLVYITRELSKKEE